MLSIGENGDIYYDEKTDSIMDIVLGDQEETNFKIARSRVISHFKYRGYLENSFIKYKRNNFTDEVIKKLIDTELDKLFEDVPKIRNKITYIFKNNKSKFLITFMYKETEETNRNLIYFTIKI